MSVRKRGPPSSRVQMGDTMSEKMGASLALTVAKNAARVLGRATSEASTIARAAADKVADAAEGAAAEASAIAKTAGDAVGRAAAEVSTIVSSGADAVGEAALRAASAVGLFRTSEDVPASEAFVPPGRARGSSASSGKVVALFATCVLGVGAVLLIWISHAYRAADIIGMFESLIFTIVFFSCAFWLTREYCAWQRLATAQKLQRDLSDGCDTASDEARFRAALRKLRRVTRTPTLIAFIDGADRNADTATLRQELDSIGLRELDENAVEVIRRGTRDVFVISLVSMNPLVEATAFCLRALGMIRRIALAYGHRPGRLGNMRLARHIFADIALLPIGMIVALEAVRGAGSAFHHLSRGATTLGTATMAVPVPGPHHLIGGAALVVGLVGGAAGEIAEKITPRVADATLAAGRMGHLGLLTIAHVRPISLSGPTYGRMRNAVYRQILGLRKEAGRQKKD